MSTRPLTLTAALALSAIVLIVGCTAGLKSIIAPTTSEQPPQPTAPSVDREPGASRPSVTARPGVEDRSGTPPKYAPPSAPGEKQTPASLPLGEKDEVNQEGLKFAENIPGVKHVKTCYSRLYGGWYLFLYIPKGKEISLQQYSWNHKTKEWEFLYRPGSIAADKLEFHLKGELEDEKCFVLK